MADNDVTSIDLPSPADIQFSAMNLLARREHSRKELHQKLSLRFEAEPLIMATLDNLAERNLQSDERFAEAFVRMRRGQGKGPIRIAHELREKGVASFFIETLIDETDSEWLELAQSVRTKRFGSVPPSSPGEKAKQIRFLQYRGFNQLQIQKIIHC